MDSVDLLAREEEFRKLNKQLEKKTNSLMKEIENTMQKPDVFSEFNSKHNTKQQIATQIKHNNNVKHNVVLTQDDNGHKHLNNTHVCCKQNNNNDLQFLHAFVNLNIQTKVFPETFLKETYTFESVCKFMASKIKLLQEQIDKSQAALNKKINQCEVHLSQHAELEGERMKLLNQVNNYRLEAVEGKNKCQLLQNKLTEKERMFLEQRSETDRLERETKRLRTRTHTLEARDINQLDEITRLKHLIESFKLGEKDFRDSSRNHSALQKSAITRLEANNRQLSSTIDKLQQLIDNLKKQIYLLSTDIMMQGLEKDYSKLLLGE